MAKSTTKSGGTSRFRLVVLEAEVADGDVAQLSQAITNALGRPTITTVQRLNPSSSTKSIAQDPQEIDLDTDLEEEAASEVVSKPTKPRSARKPPAAPTVLELDLTTEPSLESFAKRASPESDRKRFLVIVAWFKEHRGLDSVTVNHIYTAYRKLKWPTSIPDFSQPLRNLKADQLLTSSERGLFSINHLGLSEVDSMMIKNEN